MRTQEVTEILLSCFPSDQLLYVYIHLILSCFYSILRCYLNMFRLQY